MKFCELPASVQADLKQHQADLRNSCVNTPYEVCFYNNSGTRYFKAYRKQYPWGDDRGNSTPFGGGSVWYVYYGAVQFHSRRNPLGGLEWELCDGKRFAEKVVKGATVSIPATLGTKKEVLQLAAALGF